ncbi:MAG: hypothetical protein OFPII_28970 [Osedax symbiont Rs1]|nr:MAG: hypothetical protein OFPII_28970 [Osedax symbiont Rs1]
MQHTLVAKAVALALLSTGTACFADTVPMGEVMIISQRIERPITKVPASVSVVYAETIEDIRAESLSDVVRTMPNVHLQDIPGDYSYFQIRGLPRNLEQPNLPVYVDGVPHTSMYGLNLSLLDVEQIELIRGPQGNLYGSNARDGVISITTRQPGDITEWSGRIGTGNNDYRNLRLAVKTPIIENKLYGSLAVDQRKRDGFVYNTALDQDLGDIDELSIRGSLKWQATDTFSARLTLDSHDRNNGAYTYITGNSTLGRGDDLTVAMDVPNTLEQDIQGAALNMDWAITQNWTLSSVTGTRKIDTFARFDTDLNILPYGYYDTWLAEKDLFQELRLSSTPHNTDIDWLFGLSYFNNQDSNRNANPESSNEINVDMERDSWSSYANATWHINPSWTLESGLRYTKENLNINSRYKAMNAAMISVVTSGSSSVKYDHWLPKVALNWEFSDNQSVYLSYGKGLLSGGGTWLKEDTSATGVRKGTPVIYDPEISSNLELGYKAWQPESQTTLNLALFQMDINDYQHFYPDALLQTRVASIDQVRSIGIEGSITTQLQDNLQAMFSVGYNKAEVNQIDAISGATTLSGFKAGDRIPGAPKFNTNLQLTHNTSLNKDWQMRTTLNASYFGDTILDNGATLKQSSYPLLDLNTRFTFRDQWSVHLWAKNLTDERYQITRMKYIVGDITSYGQPRTAGIDLVYDF